MGSTLATPAISDGRLYLTNQGGYLYAFGLPAAGVGAPPRPTLRSLLKGH
jgi:hypothetical protein